jgi:hypothetical protein
MRTELVVDAGNDSGRVVPLAEGQTLLIGRAHTMDLVLTDRHVSRLHCQVWREGKRVLLRDCNSRNGTRIQPGGRLTGDHQLRSGDMIRLGDTLVRFRQNGPLTEEEWLTESDPELLLQEALPLLSLRRQRLYAVACCRAALLAGAADTLPWQYHPSRPTVEWALALLERIADGVATAGEEDNANAILSGMTGLGRFLEPFFDTHTCSSVMVPVTSTLYDIALGQGLSWPSWEDSDIYYTAVTGTFLTDAGLAAERCTLLREVAGNPYRPVDIDREWLGWNDGCVGKMARSIYDERRFPDLPVLADALEEAGCPSPDLVAHCRTPGSHVPGCWAIDLLLGLR